MGLPTHIKALVLPIAVAGISPAVILWFNKEPGLGWSLDPPPKCFVIVAAILVIALGLSLLVWTIRLFLIIGEGTLAPWAPTKKLVMAGPYRYVRNPMISGVLIVIAREAILFGSIWLAVYFILNFVINHFYFLCSEEPGLVRRFGKEYLDYKKNVPRWIPRTKPWNG